MKALSIYIKLNKYDLSKFVGLSEPMVSVNVSCIEEAVQTLEEDKSDSLRFRVNKSLLSIKLGTRQRLDGTKEVRVIEVGDGSIIKLFDKTPFPEKDTDVVCPHFLELKWANGCKFNCSWCYLNGTLRFRPMGKMPYLKNKSKIVEHVEIFLQNVKTPSLLNSGELSDSLVFEGDSFSLTKDIVSLFKKQDRHKLLILTKSTNVKGILGSNAQDHIITSFSLNGFEVAKRWENGAPSPRSRIKAAKKLHDAGYPVRIRIDPIVPIPNWREDYQQLIDELFNQFRPDLITIGSLRGLRSTLNNCPDTSWARYLNENSNWGKKIDLQTRLEMYSFMIETLHNQYSYDSVGICKETIGVWKALELDYRNIQCNCIL